jgi:hypothetical protein
MRRYDLLAVLTLAAAVRFLLLLLWSPELSGDALDYDGLAHSLIDGRGYVNARGEPTSLRPPLYPASASAGLATLDRRVGRRPSVALAGGTMVFFLLVCAFAEPLKHVAKGWIFGLR